MSGRDGVARVVARLEMEPAKHGAPGGKPWHTRPDRTVARKDGHP